MNLCPETESVLVQKQIAIMEELVKGLEAATQLRILLHNPFETEPSLSSHHIAKVLTSLTDALLIITSSPLLPGSADGLAHQNLLFSGENGWSVPRSSNCPTSGDCSEKGSQKGERGPCSRRKSAFTSWTELSCTTDDNHAWRKYGQKETGNSQFPRNDERLHERSDNEMQNQGNESLYDKFRGKAKISDSISSLLSLSESSDKGTDLSNSHEYSGPS